MDAADDNVGVSATAESDAAAIDDDDAGGLVTLGVDDDTGGVADAVCPLAPDAAATAAEGVITGVLELALGPFAVTGVLVLDPEAELAAMAE